MLVHNPHDELALQNIGAIYLDTTKLRARVGVWRARPKRRPAQSGDSAQHRARTARIGPAKRRRPKRIGVTQLNVTSEPERKRPAKKAVRSRSGSLENKRPLGNCVTPNENGRRFHSASVFCSPNPTLNRFFWGCPLRARPDRLRLRRCRACARQAESWIARPRQPYPSALPGTGAGAPAISCPVVVFMIGFVAPRLCRRSRGFCRRASPPTASRRP